MDLNSHAWESNLPSPLSPNQHAAFQAKLDAIVGVEPNGVKRWVLCWAPNPDTWIWNRYKQRWEPRFEHYWANVETTLQREGGRRRKGIDVVVVEEPIALPRFFIAALIPRLHRNAAEDGPGVDEHGNAYTARQFRHSEEYVTLVTLTQHSEILDAATKMAVCCKHRAVELDVTCRGDFRLPDERDIEELQRVFVAKVQSRLPRPDERIDGSAKEIAWKQALWMVEQELTRRRAIQADIAREHPLKKFIEIHNRPNRGARKNHFSIPGI